MAAIFDGAVEDAEIGNIGDKDHRAVIAADPVGLVGGVAIENDALKCDAGEGGDAGNEPAVGAVCQLDSGSVGAGAA